jgi:hypothetical protein
MMMRMLLPEPTTALKTSPSSVTLLMRSKSSCSPNASAWTLRVEPVAVTTRSVMIT